MLSKKIINGSLGLVLALFALVSFKTWMDIQPVYDLFEQALTNRENIRIQDRFGETLSVSYQYHWNTYDNVPLYEIPALLKEAFVLSEDQNFFKHRGIDWRAKLSAIGQNIKARKVVRGASTITEQVIHMLCPRPRTLWSKWLEMIEAYVLEAKTSKSQIYEFYLNQIPYASHRRGVVQGAKLYFDRDLSTLSIKEMLALVIMVKAPSSYDLFKDPLKIDLKIKNLGQKLQQKGLLGPDDIKGLDSPLKLYSTQLPVNASHFVSFLKNHHPEKLYAHQRPIPLKTTIDASLQRDVQHILDGRLRSLKKSRVHNGAVLIVNHQTGEVLAWVVGGASSRHDIPGKAIDAVTVKRQPGSVLKPFLYAAALEKGWATTTMIDDSPLYEGVGTGLHHFKNYSNIYYGRITLREALANSLNIPAVRTIKYVGVKEYLNLLHRLGFKSLENTADVYDGGLALGNGEVTLLELTQGFVCLANKGQPKPLHFTLNDYQKGPGKQIFSKEVASLIGHILSDPWARRLEFGVNSVMNFNHQTAIKTGTSTDYRDAWIVGYNHKYVVGIWMGNLDNRVMDGITGSTGPSLILRSIFSRLNLNDSPQSLYMSPELIQRDVCIPTKEEQHCAWRTEYFIPNRPEINESTLQDIKILKPTHHLRMAIDPRIPRELQKFAFEANRPNHQGMYRWILDGKEIAQTRDPRFLWSLEKGKHHLKVLYLGEDQTQTESEEITFMVQG